jgi:hypothetical protein
MIGKYRVPKVGDVVTLHFAGQDHAKQHSGPMELAAKVEAVYPHEFTDQDPTLIDVVYKGEDGQDERYVGLSYRHPGDYYWSWGDEEDLRQ